MKNVLSILIGLFIVTGARAAEPVAPTRALNGTDITYEYTSGRKYHVRFDEQGIRYRYLSGSKPEQWWGPFPYQAFEVERNVFMAAWFEAGYGDHVTLLINFNNRLLYGSALLRGEETHFHGARILGVQRPPGI